MAKYLAFDIEIARDFNRIPLAEFKPGDEEVVEAFFPTKIDSLGVANDWAKGQYREKHDDFVDKVGGIISTDFWRPVENKDWKRFRPLGITCAAASSSDGHLWNWWAHDETGRFAPKMSAEQCWQMVFALKRMVEDGYTILTWNGLSFDFDILKEESQDDYPKGGLCQELALNHVDMMFHFFASKGFPLGLDAAAEGMGLPGKPEGMSGELAPVLWAQGEYHRVLDYVSWDVKNALALAQAVDQAREIRWVSRAGRPNSWYRGERWLTVREALDLPEPDTSWMSSPMSRAQFYEWIQAEK